MASGFIDRLVVELTADISKFRQQMAEAIALANRLQSTMYAGAGPAAAGGGGFFAGLAGGLAAAQMQASRTERAITSAMASIAKATQAATDQALAAQRAYAGLTWGGGGPPAYPAPAGGGVAPKGGAVIVRPNYDADAPNAPNAPKGGGWRWAAPDTASAADMYHLGGEYVPGNRIWRIRQAALRKRAEGTPPGSPEWREYEEARRAGGARPDPNIPKGAVVAAGAADASVPARADEPPGRDLAASRAGDKAGAAAYRTWAHRGSGSDIRDVVKQAAEEAYLAGRDDGYRERHIDRRRPSVFYGFGFGGGLPPPGQPPGPPPDFPGATGDLARNMAWGISLPAAFIGREGLQAAGAYEEAMLAVKAAAAATDEEMQRLDAAAIRLAADFNMSPTTVMRSFETLIKNGKEVADVLGGAGEAIVRLSAASDAELSVATDIATDAMNNWSLGADKMNFVADQTAGTLRASKFDLNDYRLAIGMAGAAAANFGVSFEDFNAAISATASSFSSGSDAGTSFKTFLLRLVPQSREAAQAMEDLNLEFYEADGSMKSLTDIADQLQNAMRGLSEEQVNEKLFPIFGTDAVRTAMGLARVGGEGVEANRKLIAGVSATDMAEERLAGFNSQARGLKGALETLAIAIGQSGILEGLADIVKGFAGLIRGMSEASPEALKWGTILVGLAALFGPVVIAAGFLAQGVAALVPIVTWAGSMFAWLAGAAAAVIAPFGLVGAAVAGFLALFVISNLDRIGAFFGWFAARAQEVLGERLRGIIDAAIGIFEKFGGAVAPIGDIFRAMGDVVFPILQFLGEVVIRVFDAIGAVIEGALKQIGNLVEFVGAVLRGDWEAAWKAAGAIVDTVFTTLIDVISSMAPEAEAFLRQIYDGAKRWLGEAFKLLVDEVGKQVGRVVTFFKDAWDAVVGHSYVPDMVDGIAEHFGRLPEVMVEPARAACGEVVEAFKSASEIVTEAIDDTMATVKESVRAGLGDLIRGETGFGDFIADIVTKAGDKAIDKAVDLVMDQLDGVFDAVSGALSNVFGGMVGGAANGNGVFSAIGGFFGRLFGGGRAGGIGAGPVFPGRIYDVGEFGRETFIPAVPGFVANDRDMRRMRGGGTTVNHFHFPPGTDARSFQASRGQIEAMMLRAASRGRRNAS